MTYIKDYEDLRGLIPLIDGEVSRMCGRSIRVYKEYKDEIEVCTHRCVILFKRGEWLYLLDRSSGIESDISYYYTGDAIGRIAAILCG